MSEQDEMYVGKQLSDDKLRYLRRMGLAFLLAGVFLPLDILTVVVVSIAGVYFCVQYVRQRMALHRPAA